MNRYRITFARDKTMRFVGHLDLAKTWERVLRRADLSLTYSQGFHPLPKITFASALPVGCTSEAEVMDVVLAERLDSLEVMRRLGLTLPGGMTVTSVVEVPLQSPALQVTLRWAEYIMTVETDETLEQVQSQLSALLARPSLARERRGKSYDLRPLVLSLSVESAKPSSVQVAVRLLADADAGTGRPDEVLAALGWTDAPTQIHRRQLGFADNG